ncbi:MAG: AAA family ATPase [Rubripirellula sp.]
MIIDRLDLKAFGKFSDISMDLSAGPNRFHIVYGPNESGKSTSLRAITSLLFGMPHITEDNYLHNNAQMRVGGVLTDESGRRLECMRRRGRKATLRDSDDTEVIDESVLHEMLGGIDRETFLTRFGLSHEELVAGGAAILNGEGDLGQILFAAGAGVSQLREIQDELTAEANRLFTPRSTKASINAAIRELDEKRKELRLAQLAPTEFAETRSRLEAKRGASKNSADAVQCCVVELARLRNYQTAFPLVPQWRSDIEQLGKVAQTPMLDEAFTERRRQAISDREVAVSRHVELENRIGELTHRLESLPLDSAIVSQDQEIQAVFQEVAARDKADRDRLDLIRVQKNADRKIIDLLRELSIEIKTTDEQEKAESIHESVERLRLSDALRTRVHELASQYERLIQQRNDASDAVETTKRRLTDVTQELEGTGTPADPSGLASVIDSVESPQALQEHLNDHQEDCSRLKRRCDGILRRLVGFEGSIRQATQLRPPLESEVDQTAALLEPARRKVEDAKQNHQRLLGERDAIERELAQQQADQPLPTVEELEKARQSRDSAIEQLAAASDLETLTEQANVVREQVQISDQLVDTIRNQYEKVHHRQTLLSKQRATESQAADAERTAKLAARELVAVKEQWLSLWDACGVKADTPERMKRWLVDHDQLIEACGQLTDQEKRVEQLSQKVQRTATRLSAAIASAASNKSVRVGAAVTQNSLFDEPVEQDLLSLYDEAVALRGRLTRSRGQYETLSRRRDELAEELPETETRFEACQKNVEDWRSDWRRITESFASKEQSTPQVVMAMIRRIDELCEKKRERDILATRIRSIHEDSLSFKDRVMRVAQVTSATTTSADGESLTPSAIAHAAYQRLQSERAASRQRETLKEQIESSRHRLSEVATQKKSCEAVLEQLCAEAGCEAADELPEIERAARERSRLQLSLRDLENQLSLLAGEQSVEQFVAAVGDQQPALLDVDITQKEAELHDLREKLAAAQQEIGALQHELDLMDGSARASELSQSIQLVAGQISRDVEQFAKAKIASLILQRSVDHYRSENQSPVLALAEKTFQQLTCDEYRTLKVDYDTKGKSTLFGVRSDGTSDVPAHAMSTGTADALYLALRLGSLRHQLSHGVPVPFIIDDCLVQLDDARAAAALRAFSELSKTTQVILFTHHDHLRSLAADNLQDGEYHIHQLGT